jgi:hypothetical protein
MLQRGDIVVERLTGRRAIVIHTPSEDEVICRFSDGRLEDRFTFELDTPTSALSWLWAVLTGPGRPAEARPAAVGKRVRPMIIRQPTAS